MTPEELQIADYLIAHHVDLFRLEAGIRAQVIKVLNDLQSKLSSQLEREPLTDFNKTRLNALLKQANSIIEEYYAKIANPLNEVTAEVARQQGTLASRAFAAVLHINIDSTIPSLALLKQLATETLVQGAPWTLWLKRQKGDVAFRFANIVRQGMVAGETNQQILQRVAGTRTQAGLMEISKSNARALIHSTIQSVANRARLEHFRNNPYSVTRGVMQLSTLDGHTTDICIAYSGQKWDLSGEPIDGTKLPFNGGPPRHWNCRSILTPLLVEDTLPKLPVGMRASSEGPIAADTSFDAFLKRQGEAVQNDMLGVGRAQLWRDGKITLQQLLDLKGNPLTLTQLKRKYR